MPNRTTPANYLDSRCPSGRHYEHPDLTCERIGDREWDPITGYRTDKEMAAAGLPQFTGLIGLEHRRALPLPESLMNELRARQTVQIPAALRGPNHREC